MQIWLVLACVLAAAIGQEPFTLEEFVRGRFSQRVFNGTWISGNSINFL